MAQNHSRFKTYFEKGFESYLRSNYQEHYRRIINHRKSARWALFSYPLAVISFLGVPVGGLMVTITLLYSRNPSWFQNLLAPESAHVVMPLLYAATIASILLGLFFGIVLGLGKAQNLILNSERDELQVRQTYFLRILSRNLKKKSLNRKSKKDNKIVSAKRAGSFSSASDINPSSEFDGAHSFNDEL